MGFFDRFRRQPPPPPPHPFDVDEWLQVPFRFAEAARVSIYTIGSRPEISPELRWWIASWLAGFNTQLAQYMKDKYGDEVFPILDQITADVMPDDADTGPIPTDELQAKAPEGVPDEVWQKWESELNGEDGERHG